MNKKNMSKALNAKLNDWVKHIDNEEVVRAIKKDALITGGALVSLLNGEEPNDYDIYFRTKETCKLVAEYYANKWNEERPNSPRVYVFDGEWDIDKNGQKIRQLEDNGRITCFIRSVGIAAEESESGVDDTTEPTNEVEIDQVVEYESAEEKPRYRPRYFSTNAISLSDKIQIVIRFYGEVDKIHENYDFAHCTCSYDWYENTATLPEKALECIINRELYYMGSKYPLCSIIRTRKFISRGWTINAGQYLKMCLQLNELNLKDIKVFKDQLAGVDSAYFSQAVENIETRLKNDPDFKVDNNYLFELINRIF